MGNAEELAEIAGEVLVDGPMQVVLIDRDRRIAYLSRYEHGFSPEQVIGQPVDGHIPEEHRPRVLEAVERAFDQGTETVYETDVLSPDGSVRYRVWVGPVRRDGAIELVSMLSSDITVEYEARLALQEKQRALKESEERFRVLVEQAPEAIVIYDVDTGRFVDANPTAVALFGRSREALLELGPIDLSPPVQPDGTPSAEGGRELLERAAAGERPVTDWVHLGAGDEPVDCEVRLLLLPHSDRRWIRGSVTDISARKRAERENERLAAQLAQAQKMEAVGQLTGGVAHDFNNLLTVIAGSTALIEFEPDDPAQVKAHCRSLHDAIERASELTGRLLAFSRKTPLQPRSVAVASLVHEMEELLSRTLGETISVAVKLPADLWPCRVDPAQLESALLNLAINARDAMPKGGRLTIEARNLAHEGGEPRPEAPAGDYVRLVVSDEGVGIPEENLEKVIEPFFSTKEVGQGSGLGLSMVYGFVKQSGGHFCIDSEVGRGTRVILDLPRSADDDADAPAPVASPRDVTELGGGRTVLLVEDQPNLRAIVTTLLEQLGFRVLSAAKGADALAILEREEAHLLFTDMVLPHGMDGVEIVRRARELRPELRVLYMSGYTDAGDTLDGPLLQKPFTLSGLAEAIEEALRD
jgi:PAS domain S-box-containing protein